jgi:hypothetical protein
LTSITRIDVSLHPDAQGVADHRPFSIQPIKGVP